MSFVWMDYDGKVSTMTWEGFQEEWHCSGNAYVLDPALPRLYEVIMRDDTFVPLEQGAYRFTIGERDVRCSLATAEEMRADLEGCGVLVTDHPDLITRACDRIRARGGLLKWQVRYAGALPAR